MVSLAHIVTHIRKQICDDSAKQMDTNHGQSAPFVSGLTSICPGFANIKLAKWTLNMYRNPPSGHETWQRQLI